MIKLFNCWYCYYDSDKNTKNGQIVSMLFCCYFRLNFLIIVTSKLKKILNILNICFKNYKYNNVFINKRQLFDANKIVNF